MRESLTRPSTRINFGNGKVQESQVSILWNCGLWAHIEIRRVVTFYAIRWQGVPENSLSAMSVTTSVPKARDNENHFPVR